METSNSIDVRASRNNSFALFFLVVNPRIIKYQKKTKRKAHIFLKKLLSFDTKILETCQKDKNA